jgi:carbon storage regulator
MLVLSRKPGERILMSNGTVTVAVLAVDGNTVRLGITAPAEMAVHREEVRRRPRPQAPDSPAKE